MTLAAFLLMLALTPLAAPADGQEVELVLASARGLYASAAYEEALAALGNTDVREPEVAAEVERYRALCFFALGKTDEARAAVAKLVDRNPLYLPSETDVPPRLLTMLHEVRRERLPDIAKKTYADIRPQLAQPRAEDVPALERIIRITSDPDVSGVEGMEDLRVLADGFLMLARAAASAPTANTAAPSPTVSADAEAPATRPTPAIYTADDPGIVPPQTLEQTMPRWSAYRTSRTGLTFTGYVRVLIGESGTVESVALLRPVHPLYDPDLLRAAAKWRFTPAQKNGQPVKYVKVVRVIVKDQ